MSGKGKRSSSPPGANAPAKLRGYWTNIFTNFLPDVKERRGVMDSVNERTRVAILTSVVECRCT